MQEAYKKFRPQDRNHFKVSGCHCGYELLKVRRGKKTRLSKDTGTVFLSFGHCGAGVVTHELAHAILWAHRHKRGKQQYPIVIKNMKEEEEILYNLTYAIRQFYTWYWKIEKEFKK